MSFASCSEAEVTALLARVGEPVGRVASAESTASGSEQPTRQEILQAVERKAPSALTRYRELLRLPNDAQNPADVQVVFDWLLREFGALGFVTSELVSGTELDEAGSISLPLLLAERRASEALDPGASRSTGSDLPTVLVYLQADGQPVDPSRWDQSSPWEPVLKSLNAQTDSWDIQPWSALEGRSVDQWPVEWRVFARSASDSKGPVAQLLAALHVLKAEGWRQAFHLKVVIDGEEELGSPRLARVVARERPRLSADRLVIFDGPPHPSGEPTLVFGARGIATITLTTYGPRAPQHSGHFGNYVPNPALRMAQLLASMKDASGRVLIPGYYDGVTLSATDRKQLSDIPEDTPGLHQKLGIAVPEAVAGSLQESIQYPSLNIRGLSSGWVGEQARTIIPATATAELDVRLVAESDAYGLLKKVRQHIEAEGFTVIDREPTEEDRMGGRPVVRWRSEVSYGAFRTPIASEFGAWLGRALLRYHGKEAIRLRTLGGSIPISPFVATLNVPAATVPTVNPDNNQHSPNENLQLGNFLEGIGVMVAVLTQPDESVKPAGAW